MRNKKIYDNVFELIGDTPMVRLNKIPSGTGCDLLVKLEYMNPSGSLKDRIALEMINAAEKSGRIKPGDTIIESSTGNTGFALSSVGTMKGYKVCIYETMPGKAGAEKSKMMHNVGAEVRLMEPKDIETLKERSIAGSEVELPGRQLCLQDEKANPDNIWWARQFSNEDNVKAHHITAREILEQTDGKVDVFVQSIGTGGSLLGIAEVLKKEIPKVKVIGIQPASSKELWHPGMDFPVTEIKGGIVSKMLKSGMIDALVRTTDTEARDMTHRLWLEEGLYCGVSSGANVHYALEEAKKAGGKKLRIVTLLCDHMNRYLTEERYVT